jgi:hypothetical protein
MNITATVNISSSPKKVFPWIAEPVKAKRWQKGVKNGEIIKKAKDVVGTTFKEEVSENGKTLVMFGEITTFKKDKQMSFHLDSKIHSLNVDYLIEGNDNKTMVTTRADIRWKFPMSIISIFIGRKIKEGITNQTKSELTELKRLCEST